MTLLVPDVGEAVMLKNLLNHTAPQNQTLKLFKSNTTPRESDTAGTYTEADFTGYSSVGLTGSSWTISGTEPTVAEYAEQTFASTAGSQNQSVYGYYVVQASSGILLWAERFSNGPYVIQNDADQIRVTPKITLG